MALILSIDDSPTTLHLLEIQLKKLGHVTLMADNGEEGLQLARTGNPDVILLDLIMPGMDGYDVLEQLKTSDITRDIPIIIISSQTNKQNIVRVMKYEVIDYLSKKFSANTFKEKIDRAIHISAEQKKADRDKGEKNLVTIGQLGRTTLSFRSGIKQSLEEAKKTLNAQFFKTNSDSALIVDIRYIPSIKEEDVPLVEEILSLVPGDPLYFIAGKHFGTIMLNTDLDSRIVPFISWNDMEMHSYSGE